MSQTVEEAKYTLQLTSLLKSAKAVICLKSSSNYGFLF